MRQINLAFLLLLTLAGLVQAKEPAFRAGMTILRVQDEPPFEAVVYYPTTNGETQIEIGPWPMAVAKDADLAGQGRLPVILVSHGSGGSPWVHRELAAHLAREGFIVVAPVHVGDSTGHTEARQQGRSLLIRPDQAVKALETVLADPLFRERADAAKLAMIGFSAGGYTALVLAGAKPDLNLARAYCLAHPQDRGSCGHGPDQAQGQALEVHKMVWPKPLKLRALVLMDPLAITFDSSALARVSAPVLLFTPEDTSYLSSGANSSAVATLVPNLAGQVIVPGNHFVFIDPCPADMLAKAPEICQDGPGVDRVAVHAKIEAEILDFLGPRLLDPQAP